MIAIEFNNVSKQYRLGLVSTGTLAHDLNRFWQTKILRREDPYLKIGETNDRTSKGASDYVWALRNIDFKVEQGDVVGIIGRNGAGKSTLLKLLSRVTSPTTGTIRARGRIASLLEVGTGFHPEMTGRENIYMNGSIMGMRKAEIDKKLDEIVDFSGCERYIDTPVKRYSSGMKVRLGFAIAAHLEPDILIVDEVLAVGDAEFQKKAIGKMQDVAHGGGRTVLFVSHNMAAVRNLCKRGVLLNQGQVDFQGSVNETVERYLSGARITFPKRRVLEAKDRPVPNFCTYEVSLLEVAILNESQRLASDEPIEIELIVRNNGSRHPKCTYTVFFYSEGQRVLEYVTEPMPLPQDNGVHKVRVKLFQADLFKGVYHIAFQIGLRDYSSQIISFDATRTVLSLEIGQIKKESGKEFAVPDNWPSKVIHIGSLCECSIC